MNVDQVYAILRDGEQDPREALQWALDHWDEASDRLLSKLRALAAKLPDDCNSDAYDEGDAQALYALAHLFAEKRDSRAYGPLCDRLLRDIDVSAWFGDFPDDTATGLLISLCDGDLEPLTRIAMRADGDEWVRSAALRAYVYLVRVAKAGSETEARAFLARMLAEAHPRGVDHIWSEWVSAVARLGFEDLSPEVARLFSKSWISKGEMTLQDYHADLAEFRADPVAAFAKWEIGPFESVVSLFDAPAEGEGRIAGAAWEPSAPHINELRDVGRNDPCPCGSGKKFKKCCLAA